MVSITTILVYRRKHIIDLQCQVFSQQLHYDLPESGGSALLYLLQANPATHEKAQYSGVGFPHWQDVLIIPGQMVLDAILPRLPPARYSSDQYHSRNRSKGQCCSQEDR